MCRLSGNSPPIGIIDYGAGNLRSIANALRVCGAATRFVSKPCGLEAVSGVVLPGVGSFGYAVASLAANGLDAALVEWAGARPLLGICLGLQLMFPASAESPGQKGLGILDGTVVRLIQSRARKVPNMGWDPVVVERTCLLGEPGDRPYCYFAHSYVCVPAEDIVEAWAGHGATRFAASVRKGLVQGVQFHPEKGGPAGLAFLRRFVAVCGEVPCRW